MDLMKSNYFKFLFRLFGEYFINSKEDYNEIDQLYVLSCDFRFYGNKFT